MKLESSTVGIVALERREPPAIVEKPDRHDVVDGPLHRIKVTLRLDHGAMGDRVGDEFVEREIEVADGGLRHVVAELCSRGCSDGRSGLPAEDPQ
jgi:hypothetical protein